MKYCSKCGEEIYNEAVICPRCGYNTERFEPIQEQGSKVAGFCLRFFLGIFGLIIGLCLNKPLTKKGAISGFICQFIIGLIIGQIYF
ncbi:MAG: zinc-ribbon domain-containing protein [Bacilli bacterium]|jgi:uncharacterized membrane protein YvbJ|nr:zinc-ribbon domain-containing protein [Candidatus Cloacimonadota bacterium]MDY0209519.1 zinc-ribbon domain-containing protein [Bacilli bacterium]